MKISIYFSLLFFLLSVSLRGQTCNPLPGALPGFKINDGFGNIIDKICVNSPVTLIDTTKGGCNIFYEVDAANNPEDTVVSNFPTRTYTYKKLGKYKITQFGIFGSTGSFTSSDFTVLGNPTFTVLNCSNGTVNVNVNDSGFNYYNIDFGDGAILLFSGTPVSHSYSFSDLSPKTITVTGFLNSCSLSSSKTITPIQNLSIPLWIDITKSNSFTDIIRFENVKNNLRYQVFQKNPTTNFDQSILTFADTSITNIKLSVSAPDTNVNYQYYIKVSTGCESSFSKIIESVFIHNQTIPNQINLSWKSYSGDDFVEYQIYKDGQFLTKSLVQNQNTFFDTDIVCHRRYCYQIKILLKNNISSLSNSTCAIGITNFSPPSLGDVTATIENDKVIINWSAPNKFPVANYFVSENNIVTALVQNSFKGSKTFTSPICYQVYYKDSCENKSAIINACPVFLTKINNNLTWTDYQGWETGIKNYTLEVLDQNNNVAQTVYLGSGNNFLLPELDKSQQILKYRVKINGNKPGLLSYSNIYIWEQDSRLAVPTAFTPNGDNLNPEFKADGLFLRKFNLSIYNRWGQVVFASDDINKGWNGSIKGQEAPVDSYIYNIDAMDFAGKAIKRNGTFVLVR